MSHSLGCGCENGSLSYMLVTGPNINFRVDLGNVGV